MNLAERARVLPRTALIFACFLPMACSGAAPEVEVYPVRGEVFFKGEPASGAAVHFHPVDEQQGAPAFAVVGEDGSFELSTYGSNDGAEPGQYVVTINWCEEMKVNGDMVNGPDLLGDRYSKRGTTKLRATITEGENVVPRFDLNE